MARLDLTLEAEALDFDLSEAALALTEEERLLAVANWRGRMRNEHVSARIFAQLLPQHHPSSADHILYPQILELDVFEFAEPMAGCHASSGAGVRAGCS